MKTIKLKSGAGIVPENYTGIVELESGTKIWYKNGNLHREDGPAVVWINGNKSWYLDGKYIWYSEYNKLDFTNKIILSKEQHPEYPTVQVLKFVDDYGIQERIIIPGMEEWFIE